MKRLHFTQNGFISCKEITPKKMVADFITRTNYMSRIHFTKHKQIYAI